MGKAGKRKKPESRMGRPPLAGSPIRWYARLDEKTDAALDALAEEWNCSRSEAMRRVVKQRAKRMGLI